MMRRWFGEVRGAANVTALVLLAGTLGACESRSSTGAPAAASASGVASAASSAPSGAAAPELREADARALLDRWIAAQNGGDFAGYEALYAAKFEGVKRSGPRTRRFDRGGWMTDRRGMFGKKMVVEASDVEVVSGAAAARVRFVQAWRSGEFSDRGPKELVLVASPGGPKIAREEMLRSILGARGAPPIDRQRFAFVVHAGAPRMVIETKVEDAWLSGAPRLVSEKSPVVAEGSVAEARVPAGLVAWRGRKVRLFGDAGEVCQATVSGLSVLARVEPHFGMRAVWRGKPEEAGLGVDGPRPRPASKSDIAKEAWEMSAGSAIGEGGRVLVADLAVDGGGDCSRARWARDASLEVPKIAAAKAAPAALRKTALDGFRALPAYAAVDAELKKEGNAAAGRWEEHEKDGLRVVEMRIDGGAAFVGVAARIGTGCGDAYGSIFALFEVRGAGPSPQLVLVNDPADASWLPSSAVDVDGDGKVELVSEEAILRAVGGAYDQREALHVPSLDCGC